MVKTKACIPPMNIPKNTCNIGLDTMTKGIPHALNKVMNNVGIRLIIIPPAKILPKRRAPWERVLDISEKILEGSSHQNGLK